MSRAPLLSVARQRPADQSAALNRTLRRWLQTTMRQLVHLVAESGAQSGADRYRKHFPAHRHLWLLVFHGLGGRPSLRQSYAAFAASPTLLAASGLERTTAAGDPALAVSYSQFAASHTSRPAAFLGLLVPVLLARVRALSRREQAGVWPAGLAVIDSTFLRLSLKLAPWLPHRSDDRAASASDVPGVRLQVRFTPATDLPEQVVVTDTRVNDSRGLAALLWDQPAELQRLRGRTLALDLGYYGHRHLARLREAQVHWVTRQHPSATLTVVTAGAIQPSLPDLPASRIQVLGDQRVTVGSLANHQSVVVHDVRRVIADVAPHPAAARRGAQTQRYHLLTDRWDLTAPEVVQCYIWRWQIELFFRWLKHTVHLTRWLGYSPNAVALTVWLAIIVHLLAVLASHALGQVRRSPALLAALSGALLSLSHPSGGQDRWDPSAPRPDPAHQLPLPLAA